MVDMNRARRMIMLIVTVNFVADMSFTRLVGVLMLIMLVVIINFVADMS